MGHGTNIFKYFDYQNIRQRGQLYPPLNKFKKEFSRRILGFFIQNDNLWELYQFSVYNLIYNKNTVNFKQKYKQMKPNPDRDPERMKKTLRQAQAMAFTTQLFYFSIKILFCYILCKYKTALQTSITNIILYVLLLIANTYFILTTGKNPGYEPQNTNIILEGNEGQYLIHNKNEDNYCDICNCRKKMRVKHCFRCGKCVRKYDHHCPWIGACVGQSNHFRFCIMTFMQTIQAIASFLICFTSLQLYEYKEGGDYFSQQFGVFAIFSVFMFLYILFVGGLFFFHAYLVLFNLTTTEVMSRGKARYLNGVKGNPFNKGIINNIFDAINIPVGGHEWRIDIKQMGEHKQSWMSKVWSNQYYDCC